MGEIIKVYTCAQMRSAEQKTAAQGTSLISLMENAGQTAAADILQYIPNFKKALIVCGKGNNGGDGLVMARIFAEQQKAVTVVFLLGEQLSDLAQTNLDRLPASVAIRQWHDIKVEDYDLIIDAVFGTGFNGDLPDVVQTTFKAINQGAGFKVALDIPSGLDCDTCNVSPYTFRANRTYTFAAYKPAHCTEIGQEYCGEIICLDIGID